jgi:pimeloyl-ACP methyl ester carboxylesterase
MRYAARHPERLRSLILMNTVEPGHRFAQRSAAMLKADRALPTLRRWQRS